MNILIINGPNLNLLGQRETNIYGNVSFEVFLQDLKNKYDSDTISYFQSNSEGQIIDKIHSAGFEVDGIILNAGAYTHTSLAIADAIAAVNSPVIEVHISNVHKRDEVRHKSFIAHACMGVIAGFGLDSYKLAIEAIKNVKHKKK